MPTKEEFATIINITNSNDPNTYPRKSNQSSSDPVRYIDLLIRSRTFLPYNATIGLPLLMLGNRALNSNNIENYNTTITNNASVYYWTSDEIDGNNATAFYITNAGVGGSTGMTQSNNLTASKRLGYNIRCVKNKSFTYIPSLN